MHTLDDVNILMGDYEIKCDKDKVIWSLWDRLKAREKEFESLDELLEHIRWEIEHIEIES